MKFQNLKDLLSLLLPISLISLGIGFVKVVFLKQEGSAFSKMVKFLASVTFGTIGGYIASKFFEQGWQLVITSIITLLADQITNRIDKTGLNEIVSYVRNIKNSPTDTKKNEG